MSKKLMGFWIVVILLFFVSGMNKVGFCQTPTNKVNLHIKTADALVEKMTVEGLEKAIQEYEKALELKPENYEALWKIAYAYIDIIEIKTNALVVEKDEYKKPILKELGKIALQYAEKASKINPESKEAVRAELQAYGYYSSHMGIVTAILKGAAGRYKKLCKRIIELDDTFMAAVGYRCFGRFYYMAPFPLGSKKKTKMYYEKALEIVPDMIEPHYWLGMIYLKKKKYDLAKKEFEIVINNPPIQIEKHFITEFKKEAKRELDKILEKEK